VGQDREEVVLRLVGALGLDAGPLGDAEQRFALVLAALAVGDVDDGADVAEKLPVDAEMRTRTLTGTGRIYLGKKTAPKPATK